MTVSAELFARGFKLGRKDYQGIAKAIDTNGNGMIETNELKPNAGDSGYKTVKVKKGDTLYAIAKRNNTTIDTLVQLNGIKDPSKIYIGQNLKLPFSVNELAKALESQKVELCGFETGLSKAQSDGIAKQLASALGKDSVRISAQARRMLDTNGDGKVSQEEISSEMLLFHIGRGSSEYSKQGLFIHTA